MRLQYYKSQSEEKSQNQEDKGFSLHLSQQASFNLEYQWDQMDQIGNLITQEDYFIYPILDQFSNDDCQYQPDQDVNNQDFQEQRNFTPEPPRQDDGDIQCSLYYDVSYEQQYERLPDQVECENRLSDKSGITEDQGQISQQQFSSHYNDQLSESNQQLIEGVEAYDRKRKQRKSDSQEIIFQYNPQSQTQNQESRIQERNGKRQEQQQEEQQGAATKKQQKLENKFQQQLENQEIQYKKKQILIRRRNQKIGYITAQQTLQKHALGKKNSNAFFKVFKQI